MYIGTTQITFDNKANVSDGAEMQKMLNETADLSTGSATAVVTPLNTDARSDSIKSKAD